MEKQQFKPLDLIFLLFITTVVCGICLSLYIKHEPRTPHENAFRMAENISAQLLNINLYQLQSLQKPMGSHSRHPSSKENSVNKKRLGLEGRIGRDPWGNSFEYRFVEASDGKISHLLVISKGPDAKLVEPISSWTTRLLMQHHSPQAAFQSGDDVGLILRIGQSSQTSN